jgi:hypothetical protein
MVPALPALLVDWPRAVGLTDIGLDQVVIERDVE